MLKEVVVSLAFVFTPFIAVAQNDQDAGVSSQEFATILRAELEGHSITLGTSNTLESKEREFQRTWSPGGVFNSDSRGLALDIAIEYIDRGWIQDAIWLMDQSGHYQYAEKTTAEIIRLIRSPKSFFERMMDSKNGDSYFGSLLNGEANNTELPLTVITAIESGKEIELDLMYYYFDRFFGLNIFPAITLKNVTVNGYSDHGTSRRSQSFSVGLPVQAIGGTTMEEAKSMRNADRLAFLAQVFDLDLTEQNLIGVRRTKEVFLLRAPNERKTSFLERLLGRPTELIPPANYSAELRTRILKADLRGLQSILYPLGEKGKKVLASLEKLKSNLSLPLDKVAYRPYTAEDRLKLKSDSVRSCDEVLSIGSR